MSFEQTNFGFQSRKNSSYIKKDNEGAKIFRRLLDTLSIKGFVSPIQAIEVITKFLLIKEKVTRSSFYVIWICRGYKGWCRLKS